jgi:hypothetical protein
MASCYAILRLPKRRSLIALVWVLYAFVELFLYLPLLSRAFLAYAQVWETDPPCLLLFGGATLEAPSGISPTFLRQAKQHSWWRG